ncbi:MAG: type II toxin-antitoxin system death-on-curing family toxin [Verrucomicrobiota bacterium]
MSQFYFLTLDRVLKIHDQSLKEHGGSGGIRSQASLEAAVIQPQLIHHYERGDYFNVAGAYAYHLAEAQAFVDGNKRTAIASAFFFLQVNGIETTQIDSMQFHGPMIEMAAGKMDRKGLADLMRRLLGP